MGYKLLFEEEGACLECGSVFYGRRDKQFCSISCKNRWHNRQISEQRRIRVEVIAILSRNYEILTSLLSDKRLSAELPELTKAGYDPAFVTGYRKRLSGPDEFLCFDICFRQSSTRIYNLRRKNLWLEDVNIHSPGPSQGPTSRP